MLVKAGCARVQGYSGSCVGKRRETGSRHQRGIKEQIYCHQLHGAWQEEAAIKPQKLSIRAEEKEPWNLKGKIPGLRGAGMVLELGLVEAGPGQ